MFYPNTYLSERRRGRVFNDRGGTITLLFTRPNKDLNSIKVRYDIYETLEEQIMLLRSLALKENAANGLSGYEPQASTKLYRLKEATCLMLPDTWNRSGGKQYSRLQGLM